MSFKLRRRSSAFVAFSSSERPAGNLPFPLPLSAQIGYVQRNKTPTLPGLLIDAGLCRSKEPLKTVHFA